jgi:hypothetical protein|tara:strand:+ start:57 stop:284 length:228 start_codon:yes stop_codon:yes gene_type:complete
MRLSDIIKKILLELSTEIKKEENMIILRSDILNPIIKEIIDELYPYFIKCFVGIIIILIFLILTIILNLRVILKN